MKTLRKLTEDIFGFEKCILEIHPDESEIIGFTLPHFINHNNIHDVETLKIIKTEDGGFRYANPKGKYFYCQIGGKFVSELTEKELMAIYLHEIGHNFYLNPVNYKFCQLKFILISIITFLINFEKTISNPSLLFSYIMNIFIIIFGAKAFSMLQLAPKINIIWKANILTNPIKKFFSSIWDGFSVLIKLPISLIVYLFCILHVALELIMGIITFHITERFLSGAANNEKFADAFATSYGYGVELTTGLSKIVTNQTDFRKILAKNPTMYTFYLELETILINLFSYIDPHPNLVDRANHSIEHLEFELENNKNKLSKKQIKEIEESIKILKNFKENDLLLKTMEKVNKIMDEIVPLRKSKEKAMKAIMSDEVIYDYDKNLFSKFNVDIKKELYKNSNNLLQKI